MELMLIVAPADDWDQLRESSDPDWHGSRVGDVVVGTRLTF